MAKIVKLSDSQVRKLSEKGRHSVDSAFRLYLEILPSGHRNWLVRSDLSYKKLYNFDEITLTNIKAVLGRESTANFVRDFKAAAKEYVELKSPSWKSPKSLGQWQQNLSVYAYPFIGSMPCDTIRHGNILKVAAPILGRQSLRLAAVWCNG